MTQEATRHQLHHHLSSRPQLTVVLLPLLLGLSTLLHSSLAFVIVQQPSSSIVANDIRQRYTTSSLFMSNNKKQRTSPSSSSSQSSSTTRPPAAAAAAAAEFEFQELRIQLSAMMKQNVSSKRLDPVVRQQLIQYATAVVIATDQKQRASNNIPFSSLPDYLPGTKWRLVLSNEATTLDDLPQDATVFLEFANYDNDNNKKLQYKLQFGNQTFGLQSLQANSSWAYNKESGLLTFTYDDITTDMFGFRNVGVGLFSSLLKGRVNSIQTAYFDNQYWIERGIGVNGKEFVNVYVKVEEED